MTATFIAALIAALCAWGLLVQIDSERGNRA